MIIRSYRRDRRGVALVESSLGLILLLFLIFGIIEYAQMIMARQLINNAARSAARVASAGRQPATYPDGTASPSPGGTVTTTYLNTWITKALAQAPVSNVNPQYYGSNSDGSPNTSIAWNSTQFGQGFYVNLQTTYIPLFSGNRLFADSSGNKGAMVGSVGLNSTVYLIAEANN
jgi:Flp pilus assembly protein TadG